MIRRLMLALIAFTFVTATSKVSAQTSDAPYLYYFSNRLRAFVIERADGTDTRLLGVGAMDNHLLFTADDDNFVVNGPGFSPSGRWFAWSAYARRGAYRYTDYAGFMAGLDGTIRSDLFDGLPNPYMAWSPEGDQLLVVSIDEGFPDITDLITVKVALLNPERNERKLLKAATYRTESPVILPFTTPSIRWIDAQRAIVMFPTGFGSYDIEYYPSSAALVVNIDGSAVEHSFTESSLDVLDNSIPTHSSEGHFLLKLLPNSKYPLYQIENIVTGEVCRFDLNAVRHLTYWSPGNPLAILVGYRTGYYNAWIIDGETCTLTKLVNLKLESQLYLPYEDRENGVVKWSPDGRHATLLLNGNFYMINPQTKQTDLIQIGYEPISGYEWLWDKSGYLNYQVSSNANKIDSVLYSPNDDKRLIFDNLGRIDTNLQLSPDLKTVAAYFDGPILVDTKTETRRYLSPSASSYATSMWGEVNWHRGSEWIMTLGTADEANSGGLYIGVMRVDGTAKRELGFLQVIDPSLLNWLPSDVPLDLIPSSVDPIAPLPSTILRGVGWTDRFEWSQLSNQLQITGYLIDGQQLEYVTTPNITSGLTLLNEVGHPSCENTIQQDVTSPDGLYKFRGDTLYKAQKYRPILDFTDQLWWVSCAVFSPDSRHLVVTARRDETLIYQLQPFKLIATIPHGSLALAFSPDGKQLAVASGWDVEIYDFNQVVTTRYWGK